MYRIAAGIFESIKQEIDPVYRNWTREMSRKKFGDGPWNSPHRYIVYRWNGEIVSFLLYSHSRAAGRAIIVGAWTHPAHRRNGLYSNLFERLKVEAASDGLFEISSGYHRDNHVSAAMQKKQGRKIINANYFGDVLTVYHIQPSEVGM